MDWRQFSELGPSTGYIFLVVILLWVALALVIYWAFVSGTTSMGEEAKFKVVEDDRPVSQ